MSIVVFWEVLWEWDCSWVLGHAGSARLCRACWLSSSCKGALGVLLQPPGQHSSAWGPWEFLLDSMQLRSQQQELPGVVVTCRSMVAVSFLLCKRGKISVPLKHEKFLCFAWDVLTL